MPVYDLECEVKFWRAVEPAEQRAFNEAAGVSHPGWHGPQTVVSWKSPQEATIFLVLRAVPDRSPPEETVCREAEDRIRTWTTEAGLGPSTDAVTVNIQAIPRP